ncbi:hypothetical protein DPMN_167426 [Dreissena polymorpha]|uniref:Uncharacterized protein n=1 Tax=Dreissena polymorpha TaxID=45954 RepID=A0A9D4F3A6_DREPO|nr:hypothetical protein DPMN_167426 [Dreissena polymorpha]
MTLHTHALNHVFHCVSFNQVNALDGLGQTALHRVAQQGNIQACRLLIQYGIDTTIRSLQGYTAAEVGTENIQKMLRGGFGVWGGLFRRVLLF